MKEPSEFRQKKKWAKRLFFDLVWSKIDSFLFGFTTFYRLWMEFYCKVKVRFPKSFHVFIRASVRWMASPWFMWYYFCALWSFEIWRVERYESFVLRAQTTTEIRGFLFDTIKRFSVSVDKRSYPGPAVYRGVCQIWRTEIQEHWSFCVSYKDASKGLLVELLELGQKSAKLVVNFNWIFFVLSSEYLSHPCTVSRPGLSLIASSYAVELMVSILQVINYKLLFSLR